MSYATNPKARQDYNIEETFEAGIVLTGQEVKSIRNGMVSIKGAYVKPVGMKLKLIGSMISPYQPNNIVGEYDPQKTRDLLVKKSDFARLAGESKEKGITLVPLSIYDKHGIIKLEVGLGKGKKKYDKRETLKKRDSQRDIERVIKRRK